MANVLSGLRVAVTGGAGDIGTANGAALRRRSAYVTLIDRKSPHEAAPWTECSGAHRAVAFVQAEVRDRAAIARIDRLNVAIGNAGSVRSAPFLELTPEQWRDHLGVNLTVCFHPGQAAVRLTATRKRPEGGIFIGSWVQEVSWPRNAAYSAAEATLRMLARSMARERPPHRTLVNVVAPGMVNAGLARHQMETESRYAPCVRHVIPFGEPQSAEQVALATAFLCSEAANVTIGSTKPVDGGCSQFRVSSR
ncbi:MAG: SDR family oxidoreductase [Chloroflexota bacterium]|nr:SDR family oxidoreductase [Chloroflexota bacterium]